MKLTEDKVKWLRQQKGTGYELRELLWRKYGVILTVRFIREVLANRVWYDPTYHPTSRILKGEKCPWAKLNWDIVNFLRNAYLNKTKKLKELQELVQKEFSIEVNIKTIHAIVKNKKWFDPNYLRQNNYINMVIG